MKFCIITHVPHIFSKGEYFAYGPYVREMNIWLKYVDKIIIVAPLYKNIPTKQIDLGYRHNNIEFIHIPEFNIQNVKSIFKTLFLLPVILIRITNGIKKSDHVQLRCPGNVGLLGCIVQIFFPGKTKSAKYAGNWDWKSKQPWSYRIQQKILRNTFLTKNMTTLVYGEWPDKTKNIKPFFTASYSEKEKLPVNKSKFEDGVNLAFVGGLNEFKNPLASLLVLKALNDKGINVKLSYCGDGPERNKLEKKITEFELVDRVQLLGDVNSEKVKLVLQEAHFLVFISRSEGWPKAVAEAMWWGCLPITTAVSCVPQMLGNGERGELAGNNVQQIADFIEGYTKNTADYSMKTKKAMEWSRQFTLERFESEIKQLLVK
jgi:glycosyltransferase involved in cell wall biosynthesis